MPHSKQRKTHFNKEWETEPLFSPWLHAVSGNGDGAFCSWCHTTFSLSNMGRAALTSHMAGKKHQSIAKNKEYAPPLRSFFSSPNAASASASASTSTATSAATDQPKITVQQSKEQLTIPLAHNPSMTTFLIKENVTKAEIMWCLELIAGHISMRAAASCAELLPVMFPDSQIASKIQLGRTKIGYFILHGLAPYFHSELLKDCSPCLEIVVGFDESLNKVAQRGQMDINIRFWSERSRRVVTRYFKSAFLDHATAEDLLEAFSTALSEIDMKRILQVSMDGPNVNFKFLDELGKELAQSPDDAKLLNIGSCGLHNVNGALKTGFKATEWGISSFLKALYIILKNTPARRGDYQHFSGSKIFPMKFCSVRWLENGPVAERAVLVLPKIHTYIEGLKGDKKKALPKSNSFGTVSQALKDNLLICKLMFFQSVAAEVEPFLREFQSDKPMAPLLYRKLVHTLECLMARFVKPEVLSEKKSNISKIDLQDKTVLIDSRHVDIGFATTDAIKNARKKLTDKDILLFRQDCRTCLQVMCQKLIERSPLKYPLTKGISCLDPEVAIHSSIRDNRLDSALRILVEAKRISGIQADKVKRQFKELCATRQFTDAMKNFSSDDRLDDLWMELIRDKETPELASFIRQVLILSHGNANLERGFSVNKECLVNNLSEESLVAQRQIYDIIQSDGGPKKVLITQRMIHSVRNARSRYQEEMDRKKEKMSAEEIAEKEKRAAARTIKELESKRQELLRLAQEESDAIKKQITDLKK